MANRTITVFIPEVDPCVARKAIVAEVERQLAKTSCSCFVAVTNLVQALGVSHEAFCLLVDGAKALDVLKVHGDPVAFKAALELWVRCILEMFPDQNLALPEGDPQV